MRGSTYGSHLVSRWLLICLFALLSLHAFPFWHQCVCRRFDKGCIHTFAKSSSKAHLSSRSTATQVVSAQFLCSSRQKSLQSQVVTTSHELSQTGKQRMKANAFQLKEENQLSLLPDALAAAASWALRWLVCSISFHKKALEQCFSLPRCMMTLRWW